MTTKELNLKKEQTATLAANKGFSSVMLHRRPYKYSTKEPIRWFMWLHELRKWIWENHLIAVEVSPVKVLHVPEIKGYSGLVDAKGYALFNWDLGGIHPTEEEALQIAIEAVLESLPDV